MSHDYKNDVHNDLVGTRRFQEYVREPPAIAFLNDVIKFQRSAVRDWNQVCDEVTLSYNMGFVGVREDLSDGATSVILKVLLKFGVLIYNEDETWALHKYAKLCWLYCFGNHKTIKNSSAFVNKLSNCSLLFEETSIQSEIFLEAFNKVLFLPGNWHTGMNMLQSIYKLFWTNLLKPLRDLLGWKRISKDVWSCYYQALQLVKYTNNVVSSYLIQAFISHHILSYEDCILDGAPGDLLCSIAIDFQQFLIQSINHSSDDHLKLIVNFLFVSSNFLEFVLAYQNQDSIGIETGYLSFAPICKILGQVKYLEATWEQMDALYCNFPYSRTQEVRMN
jgi:hypothetical protein